MFLGAGIFGCGQETAPSELVETKAALGPHALQASPSCFEAPPESIAEAVEAAAPQGMRLYLGACLNRYARVVALMRKHPSRRAWSASFSEAPVEGDGQAATIGVEVETEEGLDRAAQAPFRVRMRLAGADDRSAESPDACLVAPGETAQAFGGYTQEISYVEQAGMSFYWDTHSVMGTLKTPWGERRVLVYGCDPDNGVSFALAAGASDPGGLRCWRGGTEASCDGVALGPFASE